MQGNCFCFLFFMCKQKPSWKCRLNKHLKLKASHMHTYLTLLNLTCFRQKRKFCAFPSPSWWNHLHMPLYSLTFKVMLRCWPRTFRSSLKCAHVSSGLLISATIGLNRVCSPVKIAEMFSEFEFTLGKISIIQET